MLFATLWLRRRFGALLIALLSVASIFVPATEAATFRHAQWGNIDIYTSDTPANTQRLLAELVEIRRQIQTLVAPVTLPDPRMQILVFYSRKDFEEFLPEKSILEKERTVISGFYASEFGLMASFVKDIPAYDFARDSIHYFYAAYLLQNAVPHAPFWVRTGVPEFLAATACRGDQLHVGGDFMGHMGTVRTSKLLPLAKLMDDAEMKPHFGASKHDNELYHESWGLWHQWLTSPEPKRREQVRKLFAAIRRGEKGDLPGVAQVFGETPEALEAARRPPVAPRGFKEIGIQSDAFALVSKLAFAPATQLDGLYAQAMLAASTGKGPGSIGYHLLLLKQSAPASPRIAEARAVLAYSDRDAALAREHWAAARELGTDNPYAYLLPAKEQLGERILPITLKPELPEELCAGWRANLDRCVALDPGCADAYYFRVFVEAFAPKPDPVAVDLVERSGCLGIRSSGELYLAVARWRLGQFEAAHRIIERLSAHESASSGDRQTLAAVGQLMRREEAKAK